MQHHDIRGGETWGWKKLCCVNVSSSLCGEGIGKHSGSRSILFQKGFCLCEGVCCGVPCLFHSLWIGGCMGGGGDRVIPPSEVVPLERPASWVGAVWTQCHLSPIHPTPDMFILFPTRSHIFTPTKLFFSPNVIITIFNLHTTIGTFQDSDCDATFLMPYF